MLYQELSLMNDLKCILEWKKEEVEIPSYADPKIEIKEHLGLLLYKFKIEMLEHVYSSIAVTGNAHEKSGFWKVVKRDFHLDEEVDIDPTARGYHIGIDRLKDLFFEKFNKKELIDYLRKNITNKGADNPYNALIRKLSVQNKEDELSILMKAFQLDEDTYESKGLTDGFIAFFLIESGLLYI